MSVGWYFLLVAAGLDLLLPFLLAPFYPGYSHRRQVMSVLGSPESPVRWVYRVWLVALGLLLCAATPDLWAAFGKRSPVLTGLLIAVLCVFALGAGVLAGLFSVNADKAVETAASRIHGVGSVLGFLALAFAPLLVALLAFREGAGGARGILPGLLCPRCVLFHPLCYGGQGGVAWHLAGPGGHMAAAYVALHVSAAGPSDGRTAHSEIDRYHKGGVPDGTPPLTNAYRMMQISPPEPSLMMRWSVSWSLARASSGMRLSLPFKSSLTSSWKDLPKMLDCQMALVSPSNS